VSFELPDKHRDEDEPVLARIWPDPDRREQALDRLLARILHKPPRFHSMIEDVRAKPRPDFTERVLIVARALSRIRGYKV
jgi:hypothetical protein